MVDRGCSSAVRREATVAETGLPHARGVEVAPRVQEEISRHGLAKPNEVECGTPLPVGQIHDCVGGARGRNWITDKAKGRFARKLLRVRQRIEASHARASGDQSI